MMSYGRFDGVGGDDVVIWKREHSVCMELVHAEQAVYGVKGVDRGGIGVPHESKNESSAGCIPVAVDRRVYGGVAATKVTGFVEVSAQGTDLLRACAIEPC